MIDQHTSFTPNENEAVPSVNPTSNASFLHIGQRRYKLRRLMASSDKYGPCEVCKAHVSDVFYQTEERYFRHETMPFREVWTHDGCNSHFGHEACLFGLRTGQFAFTVTHKNRSYAVHDTSIKVTEVAGTN